MDPQFPQCGPSENAIAELSSSPIWVRLMANHPYPLSAGIELTTACNLHCSHCYVTPQDRARELTTAEVLDVMDQLVDMGTLILTFTGGEPAIRDDFFQLIREAVQRRFVVILKSNAFALSGEDVQRLARDGLYELDVSLYHWRAREHDRFVGRSGAWQRAVGALRQFKKAGRTTRASIMMMDWNIDDILELEGFCQSEQWEYTLDFRIEPRGDGDVGPTMHRANVERLVEIVSRSDLLSKQVLSRREKPRSPRDGVCGASNTGLFVQSNGDVLPCVSLTKFPLGSVREKNLVEIWNDSESLRNTLAFCWSDAKKCESCQLLPDCQRCPATALLEHGDVKSPSALDCQLATVWHRAYDRVHNHD